MFKNFNGDELTKSEALLAVKLLKITFETGYFEGSFNYAMEKTNLDADTKEVITKELESLKSLILSINNDEDFTEEFWNKIMDLNKKIYKIFGLNEEEYYTYSVEFASKNEELAMETFGKQMELVV